MPTFRSIRNSHDQGLDYLRAPGQVLGIQKENEMIAFEKKKQLEKINQYGKKVKEMYWPSVSEKNQSQMKSLKEQLTNQDDVGFVDLLIENVKILKTILNNDIRNNDETIK